MNESQWRRRSREVIHEVLSQLSPGATDRERRIAIRKAYPFGERRNRPYRIWLSEVRKIVGTNSKGAAESIPEVRIELDTSSGDLEVKVACGWCNGSNCLACLQSRKRVERQYCMTDWKKWLEWLELIKDGDFVTKLAFADWVEEQGWPEESQRIRRGVKS